MSDMYSYSTDEEAFRGEFSTREEALSEGADGLTGITVWTGKCVPVNIKKYLPDACEILERMAESAYEDAGDVAESWIDDVSKEQRNELTDAISAVITSWLDKHKYQPNFWNVEDVVKHDIPAESLSGTKETEMERVVQRTSRGHEG